MKHLWNGIVLCILSLVLTALAPAGSASIYEWTRSPEPDLRETSRTSRVTVCPPIASRFVVAAGLYAMVPNCQCHWTTSECEAGTNQHYSGGEATYWTLDIYCNGTHYYDSGSGQWGGYCPSCWNCGYGCDVHNTGQ